MLIISFQENLNDNFRLERNAESFRKVWKSDGYHFFHHGLVRKSSWLKKSLEHHTLCIKYAKWRSITSTNFCKWWTFNLNLWKILFQNLTFELPTRFPFKYLKIRRITHFFWGRGRDGVRFDHEVLNIYSGFPNLQTLFRTTLILFGTTQPRDGVIT